MREPVPDVHLRGVDERVRFSTGFLSVIRTGIWHFPDLWPLASALRPPIHPSSRCAAVAGSPDTEFACASSGVTNRDRLVYLPLFQHGDAFGTIPDFFSVGAIPTSAQLALHQHQRCRGSNIEMPFGSQLHICASANTFNVSAALADVSVYLY